MARAIHWTVPFRSYLDTAYTVNIYEEDYSGDIVTLEGGANPVELQEDSDSDLFSAIRTTTGYLRVVVDSQGVADEIFPTTALSRYVEILKSETIVWKGYIKGESYGHEWGQYPLELELPLVSALEAIGDEPYTPFGDSISVGRLISRIYSTFAKCPPQSVVCARIGGETSGCIALSSFVDDGYYYNENDSSSAFFSGDSVIIPNSGNTVKDVLTDVLTTFGLSLHEANNTLYLIATDTDDVNYVSCLFSSLMTDSPLFSVVHTETIELPEIIGSDCNRDFVSGNSVVQLTGKLERPFDMLEAELENCPALDYIRRFAVSRNSAQGGAMAIYYMRENSERVIATTTDDIIATNRSAGSVTLIGSNILTLTSATPGDASTIAYNFDNLKDYVLVSFPSANTGYNQFLQMRTKIKFSGRSFIDCGLTLNFSAKASADTQLFEFDKNPCVTIYAVIQWGELYYSDEDSQGNVGWVTAPVYNPVLVRGDNYADGGTGYAHNPSEEDEGYIFVPRVKGFKIGIPSAVAEDLTGYITVTFYTKLASANCKQMLMTDFTLEPVDYLPHDFVDSSKDHYEVDYRKQLSVGNKNVYSYKKNLFTLGEGNHYARNVITSDGMFEQSILNRLASWYDRSIERLEIPVRMSGITPLQFIQVDGHKYAVESRNINYRDDSATITLHRLVDENN